MYIETVSGEGKVQLNVEGKIDSNTSDEFQSTLLTAFQRSSNVVINMEKVDYISSAALRAFMLGSKTAQSKGGKLTLINVGNEVMNVLVTTGFDSLLNIR